MPLVTHHCGAYKEMSCRKRRGAMRHLFPATGGGLSRPGEIEILKNLHGAGWLLKSYLLIHEPSLII